MKKGQILEGIIDRVRFPNKCIIEHEEGDIVVKNCIPGQKIRVSINKTRKGRYEGRVLGIIEKSPLENRQPVCKNFGSCGGCTYQTVSYDTQLSIKSKQVKELLDDVCEDYIFEEIQKSPTEFEYRNKMEFSFGDEIKEGPLTLGLHKKGSFHDILTTSDCKIVSEDYNIILECVLHYFTDNNIEYYKKRTHEGYLRHLVVREGKKTGELLINLITSTQYKEDSNIKINLVNKLLELKLTGRIVGILQTYNDSLADVVQCDKMDILYGRDYFFEELLGLKFKISPFSFFQTNSLGAEVLYSKVREYAGDTNDKIIFDLYSGTGTIAQILSPIAKKVVGIEIIEEAVLSARENAKLNKLDNCEFISGDVLKTIDEIEITPDLIILDPPRDGIHPKALQKIIKYGVDNIVYISCKPTSLARDIEVFKDNGYKVVKTCCVDMFPQTFNIETVALLSK